MAMNEERAGALIVDIASIEIPSGRIRMGRNPAREAIGNAVVRIHDHGVERGSWALCEQSDPSLHPFIVPLLGERCRDGKIRPADDFQRRMAE